MLSLTISDSKDDQYRIVELLDVGSTSSIFSAVKDGTLFTIKEYKRSIDTWYGVEEVETLNRCKGPHVPIVHDSWVSNTGKFCIAMEYMNHNLLSFLPFSGTYISIEEKSEYAKQLIEAVRDVHDKKIVHFNLKPENILLTKNLKLKLIDFEFAETFENVYSKQFMEDFDHTKIVKATPSYRPIEGFLPTVDPVSINEKTDIWGIGCILWDMLYPLPLFKPHTFADDFDDVEQTFLDGYDRVKNLAKTDDPFFKKMYKTILMCIEIDKYKRPTAQQLLDFWNRVSA
jgi:serine/threonine protein kinase